MRYTNSRIQLALPRQPTVADMGVYKELQTLYNSLQLFHGQLSEYLGLSNISPQQLALRGVEFSSVLGNMQSGTVQLTEAVAPGELVNIYSSTGTKGRLASKAAASRRPAHAIAVTGGVSGETIQICYGGWVEPGAFTPGALLYLDTAGAYTATQTFVVGEVSQQVGIAVSAGRAILWPAQPFRVYAFNPQLTATGGLLQDETGATLYASGLISGVTKYYEPVLVPM